MSIEALLLGVFSGVRPGTSLAAVLVLLRAPEPRRPLLFFTAAGLAASWVVGLLVVGVFHGADVAVGGGTLTAVLDIAFGAAALGFAAGLQRGWVQPPARRTDAAPRFARLRDPSPRVAAAAGVATHLPGLIYLVALNAIASEQPRVIGAGLQVALYDVLWFMIPIALARAGDRAPRRGAGVAGGGDGLGACPRAHRDRDRTGPDRRLPRGQGRREPPRLTGGPGAVI